ncbi:acyltransferase family protein [Saccharopolyspora rosea]|uniref:Acyltransferase family protein n=1 Tax=Saccharopolyspora rosea TaxID=524884 RepID=A0ABW3FMA5_9PSEU
MTGPPASGRAIPAPGYTAGFAGDLRESARPVGRLAWADAAKGACIVLVVLWHVIMKHYLQIDWRSAWVLPGAWGTVCEQLLPLRMPLFFTISGFFAVRAVDRPWRVLGRSKVAKFCYLYALWLIVHTALLSFVPSFDTARADGPLELLEQLTITPSNLWYLYALALYFVVAKLVRRVPPLVVLVAAFALSAIASASLVTTPGDRGGVYQNLVFFLAGLYGKTLVERIVAAASWPRFVALAVPYLGILALIHQFGAKSWFGVWPVTCFVAVYLGTTLAGLATRSGTLTRALTSIGRRTLPIYVMHMPLLALLHVALVSPLSDAGVGVQLTAAAVEPVLMTGVLVAICLGLHRILPSRGLFELPWPHARATPRRADDGVRA